MKIIQIKEICFEFLLTASGPHFTLFICLCTVDVFSKYMLKSFCNRKGLSEISFQKLFTWFLKSYLSRLAPSQRVWTLHVGICTVLMVESIKNCKVIFDYLEANHTQPWYTRVGHFERKINVTGLVSLCFTPWPLNSPLSLVNNI